MTVAVGDVHGYLAALLDLLGQLREGVVFVARLKNLGAHPLTPVSPGDGSLMGRRTPVVTWTFEPGGSPEMVKGCGNINSLTP